MAKSYNPFSVDTQIPWLIIFNLGEWAIMCILDAIIGSAFDRNWKASLCLFLFIVNLLYFVYIFVINMALVYRDIARIIGQKSLSSLDLWDVTNIFFGNGLVWSWIFASLYYFNRDFYSTNIVDEPRYLIYVATRIWAFTVISGLGVGYGITISTSVVTEVFSALNILSSVFISLVLMSAMVSQLLTKYEQGVVVVATTIVPTHRKSVSSSLSPFSVETSIPWLFIFNVALWLFVIILDASIGESFSSTVKASLCTVLFVINLAYYLYIVIVHMALIYPELHIKSSVSRDVGIDLWDILNIFFSGALVWTWLFTALYYFRPDFYVSNLVDKPRFLFEIAARFWYFTVWSANGIGYGAIIPANIVPEIFVALNTLLVQYFYIVFFGAVPSFIMLKYTINKAKYQFARSMNRS